MTLATMADRSKPLAYRVQAALGSFDRTDATLREHDELLADIAAADRLARACAAWYEAVDEAPLPDHGMSAATAAEYKMDQAADAYRASKGVDRG